MCIWPFRSVDSVYSIWALYQIWLIICYSHWDRHTYASGFHLMTSRELTSGFDFWSRGHLRMAVMHLPINLAQISLSSTIELLTFFRNPRRRQTPSWIFRLCEFCYFGVSTVWHLCSVSIWFKYMLWSLRSTHLCWRPSFDDVTRINFRFRLLVMWSSAHGRGASSHIIFCKISLSSPKLLTFFQN